MMEHEKFNQQDLDRGYSNEMSTKDWVITILLTCIPIANIVLLIIWAVSDDRTMNPNKRNWAKAQLIVIAIMTVVMIIFYSLFFALIIAAASSLGFR